jgi:hypothetical protein
VGVMQKSQWMAQLDDVADLKMKSPMTMTMNSTQ